MDVEKSFHMAGGVGENSYSQNSSIQKKGSDMAKFLTLETIRQVYLATAAAGEAAPKSFGIADLGCSSGPNTLSNIKDMVGEIDGIAGKRSPEFRVYLSDLPTNDFNALFQALPSFYSDLKKTGKNVYIGAYPGTFYGRLFPDQCLHLAYSSYSLHWLSQVPGGIYDENGKSINKGSVYITKRSPPEVAQAYAKQFQQDFSLFLRSRSKELLSGGGMVLILLGRNGPDHLDPRNSFLWEILSRSFAALVHKGIVEEEKFDSYDVHYYTPSKEELEDLVRKESDLKLERLEAFEIERPRNNIVGGTSYGTMVAMSVRAIQESMISHHFGHAILDPLFQIYGRFIDQEIQLQDYRAINFVLVLRKL